MPRRKVTKGMDVLHKLEELPTRREGIFVMPLQVRAAGVPWLHQPARMASPCSARLPCVALPSSLVVC